MQVPRRSPSPVTVYLGLSGGYWFFFTIFVTVSLIWQTERAGLNPLQLVLMGTILEATVFLCEVPTGLVADSFGRRRSVLIGLVIVGIGVMITGLQPEFWLIALGQVVWGFGFTFISGAKQAWIADEVGPENVGPVYLKSAQVDLLARIAAVPVGTALALVRLNLPILVAGACFILMALVLRFLMQEHGFRPRAHATRSSFRAMSDTMRDGIRLVRVRPLLLTILAIAAFYGMASEGFDRLWVKHIYDNTGFPTFIDLKPVVWFSIIRMGSMVLSIAVVEVVRRRLDTNSHRVVAIGLLSINALQFLSLLLFALAGSFWMAMAAFWGATVLSRVYDPIYLAWINQNVESSVRATVISMSSQADAFGQIGGGPVLGVVGTLASLRAALVGAAIVLMPVAPLYARALRQGGPSQDGPALVTIANESERPQP